MKITKKFREEMIKRTPAILEEFFRKRFEELFLKNLRKEEKKLS